MPANFGPLRASSQSQSSSSASASASAPAAVPARPNVEPDEFPAAAEEAELPVAERVDVDYKSVMIKGVKMDSNTPLRTLRGACESLGLSKTGGKAVCLERLWKHLESQELIAAHAAHRDLRGDGERPVYGQPVPAEPSEAEKAARRLDCYIPGTSKERSWRELLLGIEEIDMKHPCYTWATRVPLESNVADPPAEATLSLQSFWESWK